MSSRSEEDKLGHDSEAIAGFLPLVDVLLAVLCVALVSVGGVGLKDVAVRLPEADALPSQTPTEHTLVHIDRAGQISVANELVSLKQLCDRLTAVKADQAVLIAADPEATYSVVAVILQRLNTLAIKDVRLLFRSAEK